MNNNASSSLRTFIGKVFSWESIAHEIMWAAAAAGLTRILVFVFGLGLSPGRELLYWVSVPALFLLALGLVGDLARRAERRPEVIGEIESLGFGEAGGTRVAGMFVFVRVRNLGSPSIADDWEVHLTLANGETHRAELHHVSGTITMIMANGTAYQISGADLIYEKTVDPIATGAAQRGVLLCVFPRLRRSTVEQPGNVVRVICRDVTGAKVSFEMPVRGGTGPLAYRPGLRTLSATRDADDQADDSRTDPLGGRQHDIS